MSMSSIARAGSGRLPARPDGDVSVPWCQRARHDAAPPSHPAAFTHPRSRFATSARSRADRKRCQERSLAIVGPQRWVACNQHHGHSPQHAPKRSDYSETVDWHCPRKWWPCSQAAAPACRDELVEKQGTKPGFLVQGTLYPDVIESCPPPGSGAKHSHTIKSHHNVGGLPKDLQFELIEPLRELFKDEVRKIGRVLGVPEVCPCCLPFPSGPPSLCSGHSMRQMLVNLSLVASAERMVASCRIQTATESDPHV